MSAWAAVTTRDCSIDITLAHLSPHLSSLNNYKLKRCFPLPLHCSSQCVSSSQCTPSVLILALLLGPGPAGHLSLCLMLGMWIMSLISVRLLTYIKLSTCLKALLDRGPYGTPYNWCFAFLSAHSTSRLKNEVLIGRCNLTACLVSEQHRVLLMPWPVLVKE